MKVLVTGATGNLGTKIVKHLLDLLPAEQLAVSVRKPEKAEKFRARGVEVRHGDFDRPETLASAFAGIDRLLMISSDGDNETRIRQHANAVAAAGQAKVKFLAYTSVANAGASILSLAQVHRYTEEAILKTGIPYSFLRNNWYLENEIANIRGVLAGIPWTTAAGAGKVGWALKQDYAKAAAIILAGNGHENTIYELSGKPLTVEELAFSLETVIGRKVPVQQVDDNQYFASLKSAGMPDFVIPMLSEIQTAIRNGALDVESNDYEKLCGHPVTPMPEALAQIVQSISPKAEKS